MVNSATVTQSKTQEDQRFRIPWQAILSGGCLSIAAALTGLNSPFLQQWERQTQTFFFEIRGAKTAPDDIIILAIDDESLAQSEYYRNDPEQYSSLAPIEQWPWRREAYAIMIERLIGAGAKAVSLDILLTTESAYGAGDDERLASVLETYGDRVTLAMKYEDSQLRQGSLLKPTLPTNQFLQTGVRLGNINFPIEMDGRIHRQAHVYLESLEGYTAQLDISSEIAPDWDNILSFAESTLTAADVSYPQVKGSNIHFWGPTQTFRHIPFWYILDEDLWQNYLESGAVFEDKIVLVGSTASQHQDFHNAPFAKGTAYPLPMAGVEILANDIATLRSGKALRELVPESTTRAGFVIVFGAGFILLLSRSQRALRCLMWTAIASGGWLLVSYASFVGLNWILPTAGLTATLLVCGGCYSTVGLVSEQLRKQRFRNTLAQYATSPIVQEILSQEEEYRDLLQARQAEVVGTVLGARYQVVAVLGYGGFSETYTAVDTQRPGNPICVVKRLKIVSDDPQSHHLAHRLFLAEAHTLERLGHHNQIPRLLAHFESASSFYLVEEMIQGTTLKSELVSRQPKSQAWVMNFLLDILPVIDYVHSHGVIHRDIKPSNLIRRAGDGRLVLIDFGSVKEISNQLTETDAHVTSTIGIGTKGYMPSEQSAGMPRFSSDLYAVGVTAIEALAGVSPYKLTYDDRGELIWQYKVPDLHPALGNVISKLVRYDFSQRYNSAEEVLAALKEIPVMLPDAVLINDSVMNSVNQQSVDDEDRWDEPTGYLPTDWATDSTEKSNSKF
ncbi:serine/threonine-protein kinase [Oscillatoria sp. CS-180]|uniref:serine/threonine-protein kinase n=1 Tax=Oscillatoria sp. CS-180 TaxID=3021720 RepID=UPI00232DEC07|nr:serine/threonine-protein kinase [Oscillatoria sp. CS-180]MDB9525531.1 serine/threonine-protein kinase [Oscillatoria sp. CS-180]